MRMHSTTSRHACLVVLCVVGLATWPGRCLADDFKTLQVKMPTVASVAISPDGKTLATGGSAANRDGDPFSCNEGTIRLWDLPSGREKATFWQSGRRKSGSGFSDVLNWVSALVFSPDGKYLVAGDQRGYRVWELSTGKEHLCLEDGFSHSGAVFSPDGKILAVPANGLRERNNGVRLVEVATGREVTRFPAQGGLRSGQILSVAFSPDGKLLATAGSDCDLTVWDLSTKSILFEDEIRWLLESCSFSPCGSLLVAAGEGGVLKLYKVTTQGKRARLEKQEDRGYLNATYGLVFSQQGKELFAVSKYEIVVWDPAGWRKKATLKGNCVAMSRDGKLIAIGQWERGIIKVGELSEFLR